MAVAPSRSLAPGARVVIRDEEWVTRSVRRASFGGDAVHVTGVSELVRGKNAIFLTGLDEVRELKPQETELVPDDSPRYRRSRLYLESLLRRTPPTGTALYVGHRGAIERANYQLQPAAKALAQPRPRILMADGVGLGKTIEVGILLSELIRRGRGDRILVVALKSILAQFQQELWARFTIPLVRLDSVGMQRVQAKIPSNMNPFYHFNRAIISIDTLKRDAKYRRYLEKCHWDAVVVDECQNVAVRTQGGASDQSQRARLAQLLAGTCDALILTSATPHDGRAESFASLMNLLEPTAVANESDYTRDEVEDLFLRRFKKDVAHEVAEQFQERKLELLKETASAEEDAVFDRLATIEFRTIDRERRNKGVLFRTLLLKGFLSSPAACVATIEQRLAHKALEAKDDAAAHDRALLEDLRTAAQGVGKIVFRKYQRLVRLLRDLGLPDGEERVVIFSERLPTLEFLRAHLTRDLGLGKNQLEVFHGTLDDQEQKRLVRDFGTRSTPLRILLASDAASEGINLHFFCHRMVHFDLPWSLITLEQRNGRIDRFGQKQQPEISYLLTIPSNEKLKGDLRVLERLIEKEKMANKNLGDVAWLLDLHDAEKEEDHIAAGIQEGQAPEEIIPDEPRHTDFMKLLFPDDAPKEPPAEVTEPLTLFADDLAYAKEAFEEILEAEPDAVEVHEHLEGFSLRPPQDLLRRFDYLPKELLPENGELKLTTNRIRVMQALEDSREDEGRWPEWQLFWELHPVSEWLSDQILARFERHEAPVLRMAHGVEEDERIFLFEGLFSNYRSQPALADWFGVAFRGTRPEGTLKVRELIARTKLDKPIANPMRRLEAGLHTELSAMREPAVSRAKDHMLRLRQQRAEALAEPLKVGLRKLKAWKDRTLADIQKRKDEITGRHGSLRQDQVRRFQERRDHAEKLYEERKNWIDEGMRTVEEPYLRLAAVLIHQSA